MSKYFHNHCDCNCHKPQYIVLFCGDDSNFVGNQTIFIELETDIDTTGCKAHLKYISKTFTWDAIPEDKRLELVFSAEETKAMPLGDWDAELWLEDAQGRRRTVSNQIRIRVTKSVGDAYWSEDPQSIKASIGNSFDYNNSYNKPTLNGVVIEGNKTSEDYHIKGGGGGTGDYNDLENKPKINGVELVGNKSLDSLGAQAKLPTTEYDTYDITVTMADRAASDLYGRAIPTTYAKVQDVYDKSEVDGKLANMVSKDDVVPVGDGMETIATIGGKDIKAPASPVSSVNGKTGAVKLGAQDVGALALGSSNKVGSLFSMDFEGEETSGGNLSFGVGMGPAGRTFIANKLYCSDKLYANGFVITNTSGAPGESVLNRIQEYGGDYKTALDEVNGIVGATAAYPMTTVADGALKDRTVNHATAGGTFTFPERTGTNARDFVLVIDALETAPTVTFPGSVTYVSEQDAADIWTAEAGKVNAWYFSEQTDGVFMVCHKAMGVVAQ